MDMLDQLKTLIAVADAGSFTKAGHALGKSKALVSKHVSDLEDRLEARLLNRTTRQVALTDVGAAFVDRARGLVGEFDELVETIRSNTAAPRGRLRITAPQAFGELAFMQLLCAFRENFPEIQPDVFLADRSVDVVGEGFDVAIRISGMADSALIVRKLCDVPVRVCASPDYLAEHGRPKRIEDLIDHACITDSNLAQPEQWRFRSSTNAAANGTVVRVRSAMQVNSAVACRQAAVAGQGIVLSPEFVVGRDLASGALVELFADQADYDLSLHLLYPHRQHLSTKARAFIDFAVAWYGRAPKWQELYCEKHGGDEQRASAGEP